LICSPLRAAFFFFFANKRIKCVSIFDMFFYIKNIKCKSKSLYTHLIKKIKNHLYQEMKKKSLTITKYVSGKVERQMLIKVFHLATQSIYPTVSNDYVY